jgi:hypothetical protein
MIRACYRKEKKEADHEKKSYDMYLHQCGRICGAGDIICGHRLGEGLPQGLYKK